MEFSTIYILFHSLVVMSFDNSAYTVGTTVTNFYYIFRKISTCFRTASLIKFKNLFRFCFYNFIVCRIEQYYISVSVSLFLRLIAYVVFIKNILYFVCIYVFLTLCYILYFPVKRLLLHKFTDNLWRIDDGTCLKKCRRDIWWSIYIKRGII